MIGAMPPPNPLPMPVALVEVRKFIGRASKFLHAEDSKFSDCRRVDPSTIVCLYNITIPKGTDHPHETCIGQITVSKDKTIRIGAKAYMCFKPAKKQIP